MPEKEFSLRTAVETDAPTIRAIIRVAQINPIGLDWRRFLLAVSADGEVVGCGQVKPHGDGTRELASIAVIPAWRGRGVARAIIERLLASHPGPLYLTTRAHLGPLYEKFGFRSLSPDEMPPYFRRISRLARAVGALGLIPEDLLVMKREA
jgi:N-acetylglutamate synthase-like GNAT family acetyltransferase